MEFKTDDVREPADLARLLAEEDYLAQAGRYLAAAERLLGRHPRFILCLLNCAGGVRVETDLAICSLAAPTACYRWRHHEGNDDMSTDPDHPIADSYWVVPGRLLASEYPGDLDAERARQKVRRPLAASVTLFLDLTEEGELQPYTPWLSAEAASRGGAVEYQRFPIPDRTTPPTAEMTRILDAIDTALAAGRVVYVHCWGGIGRTGAVVGCYLVRQGRSGPAALGEIARLRADTPDGHRQSPETAAQRQTILDWPLGR